VLTKILFTASYTSKFLL